MNLEQIEAWLKANGYELKHGYWRNGTHRFNICAKTVRLERFFRKADDSKEKWHCVLRGYFSQLYVDKNGKIGGMR